MITKWRVVLDACFILSLGMEFYAGQNISGWFASEKLDGVFARWENGVLFNKEWRIISAPESLTKCKPDGEGEIWHKDGLERVQACLSWHADDLRWNGVQFIPHISIPTKQISNEIQAIELMDAIVSRGGEGIVLRCPKTGQMLKMKPMKDDEAEVIGYTPGTGRNPGIGSLILCRCGKTFNLSAGLSNRTRSNPPEIGQVVTFSFDGMTKNGLPRNARFLHVRIAA